MNTFKAAVKSPSHVDGSVLAGLATLTFVILKLAGVVTWSWWAVFSPIWVPIVLVLAAWAVFGLGWLLWLACCTLRDVVKDEYVHRARRSGCPPQPAAEMPPRNKVKAPEFPPGTQPRASYKAPRPWPPPPFPPKPFSPSDWFSETSSYRVTRDLLEKGATTTKEAIKAKSITTTKVDGTTTTNISVTLENLAFCENEAAGSQSKWHIRKLTDAGKKLGGGADTKALCGHKVCWDLHADPKTFLSGESSVQSLDEFICLRCLQALGIDTNKPPFTKTQQSNQQPNTEKKL